MALTAVSTSTMEATLRFSPSIVATTDSYRLAGASKMSPILKTSFVGNSVKETRRRSFRNSKFVNRVAFSVSASGDAAFEKYEVELLKPYGLKFYRGNDNNIYIDAIAPATSAYLSGLIKEGDRVIATSAVFGDELWPAAEYGRTMYTVKNRVGPLLLKMEDRKGVRTPVAEAKDAYIIERNSGNYGDAVRDKQIENYLKKVEMEELRSSELNEGLKLYKEGKYDDALVRFQTVIELQPSTRERAVTSYNMACCYSKLNQIEFGLAALDSAMDAGFEDYKQIRSDPDLAAIRESSKFVPLINRYDEPFINENAMKALSSVFGIFGSKK